MLKGIDPLLGPELLATLRAMGHGDEIAIVDANYPAAASGRPVIRLDGADAVRTLDAVLSVMPLDDFAAEAAWRMAVVGDPSAEPPVVVGFQAALAAHAPGASLAALERFAFYDRVRASFAVVATGERRLYGNVLLRKGVVRDG